MNPQDDELIFADEISAPAEVQPATEAPQEVWKVLVVDDEPQVHTVTKLVLRDLTFKGRKIQFCDAYSAAEAKKVLAENPDVCLALVDVVMEEEDAGLHLVEYIRDIMNNKAIRIILRTGQPGYAPEKEVIIDYDINDYKEKTEMSAQKLITCVITAIRNYEYIDALNKLTAELEQKVFDLVARAFIAAFYDDCKFETTTVMGEVKPSGDKQILFRTTGKVIIEEGWRVVFKKKVETSEEDSEQASLPVFEKGESGPHIPSLSEKWTTPPKPYTDATLLRAMETAGKTVEDEELRDALKENGIGRPSTRAAIIETLIRRHYIRRERSSLHPTQTGFELIDLIHEELLKSAELTGRWEKKLRQIERHEYEARTFLDELKQMVSDIVLAVLREKKSPA